MSPLLGASGLQYLGLSGNRIIDPSALASHRELVLLDISNQKISLADATSGLAFTLPKIRSIDGAPLPVTIASGQGKVEDYSVIWDLSSDGEGTLTWFSESNLNG